MPRCVVCFGKLENINQNLGFKITFFIIGNITYKQTSFISISSIYHWWLTRKSSQNASRSLFLISVVSTMQKSADGFWWTPFLAGIVILLSHQKCPQDCVRTHTILAQVHGRSRSIEWYVISSRNHVIRTPPDFTQSLHMRTTKWKGWTYV